MSSFLREPEVRLTDNCYKQMEKHHLKKEDVLWTFNKPHKETRKQSEYYQYSYMRERNFGSYEVGIFCHWNEKSQKWSITTCWSNNI